MQRWTALVTFLGVLLHAGLIARHNAMVLAAKLDHGALVAVLGVICHGNGGTSELADAERPTLPEQEQERGSCPLCAGLSPAAAVLSDVAVGCHVPDGASARMAVVVAVIRLRLAACRPHSRGPPAVV
ncbi:MAG: DUF2946 family protein [Hyphomicrobium sp.]